MEILEIKEDFWVTFDDSDNDIEFEISNSETTVRKWLKRQEARELYEFLKKKFDF